MKLQARLRKLSEMRYGDALGSQATFLRMSEDEDSVFIGAAHPEFLFEETHHEFQMAIRTIDVAEALVLMDR